MSRKAVDTRQVAWANLLHAHALLVRRMDEELAAAGVLSMEAYDVLHTLGTAPAERLRLSDLADRVVLTRSGITRLADRLERQGLLRRESCPTDRRACYAVLTDHGRAELKRTWAVYAKAIRAHFGAALTEAEAATLEAALGRIVAAAREPEIVPLTVRGEPTS